MNNLDIFFHHPDKEIQNNNKEKFIYPFKKRFSNKLAVIIPVTALCASSVGLHAATLGERAVYEMRILPAGHAAQIGQCSAFTFGDISALSCPVGGPLDTGSLVDNSETIVPFIVDGGDGVPGDGYAGIITIETDKADAIGDNTFTVTNYQVDPYLQTAGGTFKTTMTPQTPAPPVLFNGKVQIDAANTGTGTVNAAGQLTIDVTGRTGNAAQFATSIGFQEWNRDDTTRANIVTETGLYEQFTTGTDCNADIPTGGTCGAGSSIQLTGRNIADTAPTDGILDAILVSAGNVGVDWTGFNGVLYSEAYNVQFVLVSAKPVAQPDTTTAFAAPTQTTIALADLLLNDTHAEGDTLVLDSLSATTEAANGSTIIDAGGGMLTYSPPTSGAATQDSFDYTIRDLNGDLDTATVTVLFPTGNPPVAVDDNASLDEDTFVILDPVANDTDAETLTDNLELFDFDGVSTNAGTIVASAGGLGRNVTYTPPANYSGADDFNYVVHDGDGNLVMGNVSLIVDPVNDAPICQNLSLSTINDTPLQIDTALLATCSDIDIPADTFAITSVQTPTDQGGTVTTDGVGAYTYTPATGFEGTDTFTYIVNDGTDDSVARTVTMTVGKFGNFTMLLKAAGDKFGGTNDIIFDWPFYDAVNGGDLSSLNMDTVDYTNNLKFDMSITSSGPQPFFGAVWTAHTIRVFGPGTYSFDSGCTTTEIATTGCPAGSAATSGPPVTMTIGTGQVGAHILFDYNGSFNIDVLNVWDFNGTWNDPDGSTTIKNDLFPGPAGSPPDPTANWLLVSRDVNGDGINGLPMVDGPFVGYYANFNDTPDKILGPADDITSSASDTKLGEDPSPLGSMSLGILLLPIIGFFRRRLKR